MKIWLVYADYKPNSTIPPYPVRCHTKKEARDYFAEKYSWLTVSKIDEYTGDPNEIEWFW